MDRASWSEVPERRIQREIPSSRDKSPLKGSTGPSSASPPSRAGPKPVSALVAMDSVCRTAVTRWWTGAGLVICQAWHARSGRGPSVSGWSTSPSASTRPRRTRASTSTSSKRGPRIGSATRRSTSGPATRSRRTASCAGFDLGGGEYVILSDEELETAEPKKSRQIEISDFVGLADIDPVFFRSSYYLAPEGEGADKAYALLRQAMADSGRVALATMVMRNKEYLVAIRPEADALALHTMYFADEVRSPGREFTLPETEDVSDRELSMAELLIQSMESEWDPARFHDTHRAKVEALIEEKRSGHEIVIQAGPEAPAKVVDLMEALNASIAAAAKPGAKAAKSEPAAKRSTARRAAPAAKKPAKAAKAAKQPARAKPAARRKAS